MRFARTSHISPTLRTPPDLRYLSAGKAKMKRAQASKNKSVRMREWLEELLDEGSCKCLAWVNKEAGEFKITWYHASRHDFNAAEHADLFIRYAELTGRLDVVNERSTKKGYNCRLKSNFRSALHSLIDCIPVKGVRGAGGEKGENAVKVYQFIDPSHPEYKRRKAKKNKNQRECKTKKSSPRLKKRKESVDLEHDMPSTDSIDLAHDVQSSDGIDIHHDVQSSDSIEDDMFISDCIDIPDEAEKFLKELETNKSEYSHFEEPGAAHVVSSFSSIPSSSGATVDITSLTNVVLGQIDFSEISQVEAIGSVAESNNLSSFVLDSVNSDCIIINPPSELPNFSVLGVDDTFDKPVPLASQRLNSGGSVRVKKEKSFPPQLAVQDFVSGIDTLTGIPLLDGLSFSYGLNDVSLPLPSSSTESIESTSSSHLLGQNVFQPVENEITENAGVPSEEDTRPAVLVHYQTHDPNFQAENYDIYPMMQF